MDVLSHASVGASARIGRAAYKGKEAKMATATEAKQEKKDDQGPDLEVFHQELTRRAKKLGIAAKATGAQGIDFDALGEMVPLVESWPTSVRTALKREKQDPSELSTEQQARAAKPPSGLRGKALVHFVLTGEGVKAQAEKAKANRPQPKKAESNGGPRPGSSMAAALKVLEGKPKGMKPVDILKEAKRRRLVPGLKGKTPEATLAAQLAVEAKRGRFVKRVAPATFALLDPPKSERKAAKA